MTQARVFDPTPCDLGEGPLWHPLRGQFYWFDINAHRLHTREDGETRTWQFDEYVSAAGWVDETRLVIASESGLSLFDLEKGTGERLCDVDRDNPLTRSNDCRADPQGGFWFGTMGKNKEPGAGAIWRYYRGELRQLFAEITISNAICFAPSGDLAYFADTPTGLVWQQRLDAQGWPRGDRMAFLDLPADRYRPDGAVVDAAGDIWIAHYGHGKVVRFGADGTEKHSIAVPGVCPTCPAFGGADLSTLLITTARQNLAAPTPQDGQTFVIEAEVRGQAEHRVIL
ncbi:MAG: SMP-30/gluconolactonase/LRE family protein [Sulfitobacter sp.]|nr:SMP-30/gluconolactonase/LRE family protein [Sulfitobacter sp.]